MLTLFTIPKPFVGHTRTIQANAIRSWSRLEPPCEIILFGNEVGTKEFAHKLGIRNISDVKENKYGTPLLNDIFQKAQEQAKYDLMVFINADIILLNDFINAITLAKKWSNRFLMVGRRLDLDLDLELNFDEHKWQDQLRLLSQSGRLHSHTGIDYFAFKRGQWSNIPPFAIGRTVYDHWLIYQTRALGIPILDATQMVTAIHQNHSYSKISSEASINRKIATKYPFSYLFSIKDATHLLQQDKIVSVSDLRHFYRRILMYPLTSMNSKLFVSLSSFLLWLALKLGKKDSAIERSFKNH